MHSPEIINPGSFKDMLMTKDDLTVAALKHFTPMASASEPSDANSVSTVQASKSNTRGKCKPCMLKRLQAATTVSGVARKGTKLSAACQRLSLR